MTMRKYADLLATVGEHKDAGGRQVKTTVKVGALFRDSDSGRMSCKLDLIPVRPAWSGWLRVQNVRDEPGNANEG